MQTLVYIKTGLPIINMFSRRFVLMNMGFLVSLIALSGTVSAIGISPSRIDVNFEPGFYKTYQFYVRAGNYGNIKIYSECDLSEYIMPSINEITLSPGELRYFNVIIELPEEIDVPGTHRCSVVAEEVPVGPSSGVVAYSAVETPIIIRVPYPHKYLESTLHVSNVEMSQPVNFTVSLLSRGLENVMADSVIRVTDVEDVNLATLYTERILVESLGHGSLSAVWDTTGVPPGRYYASSTVEYGGEEPSLSHKAFKIGDMLIKIVNVTYPEEIHPDDIVKFEVEVDSYWNSEINDVYLTLGYVNEGTVITSSTSETFDMESWGNKKVSIFWDTNNLDIGEYNIIITAYYSDRSTEKSINVEIRESVIFLLDLTIIAILIAVMVAVLYILRRKRVARKKGEFNAL